MVAKTNISEAHLVRLKDGETQCNLETEYDTFLQIEDDLETKAPVKEKFFVAKVFSKYHLKRNNFLREQLVNEIDILRAVKHG